MLFCRRATLSDVGLKQQGAQYWNVSLRSVTIDVARVAGLLGGGGHRPAAGYSARGTRDQVIESLLGALP